MTDLSRRRAAQTLFVGGLAAACATTPRPREPIVSINLADTQPPESATGTRLETAFDEAKRMTVPVRSTKPVSSPPHEIKPIAPCVHVWLSPAHSSIPGWLSPVSGPTMCWIP